MVLIAACGGDGHPELHIDVQVSNDLVYVYAIEVDRPDATSQQPFQHPGGCDQTSDGWSCDGECPAQWLGELRIEQDGESIAEGQYDWPWGGGVSVDLSDAVARVLIIEDQDGVEVEVPLPVVILPVPTITATTWLDDELEISWTSDPAATSAVVEFGGGFGGPRCHVDGDEGATRLAGSPVGGSASVRALAAPSLTDTAFGQVEVWTGTYVSVDVTAP